MTMTENKKTKPQISLYERAVAYVLNLPKTEKQVRQWYARKTNEQNVIFVNYNPDEGIKNILNKITTANGFTF